MRYSRMQNAPKKRNTEAGGRAMSVVMVLIVVGAIIYFAAAGMLGSFVSDNIVEPVAALFSGEAANTQETDTPSSDEAQQTKDAVSTEGEQIKKTIEPEKYTLYALQLGVFGDKNNAQELAKSSAAQGGAGFVLEQSDQFRVLLSAYKTEDEAKNVRDRLKAQQMETSVREIVCDSLSIDVTSTQQVIDTLKETIDNISKYIEDLRELSVQYDKDTGQKEIILQKLTDIDKKITNTQNTIDELAKESDNSVITQLSAYYDKMSKSMVELKKDKTDIELSSALKYTYLELFSEQTKLFEKIAN